MRAALWFSLLVLLACLCRSAWADELVYRVNGVEGALADNVLAAVQPFRITGNRRLDRRRLQILAREAETLSALALRPFGHYHARVSGRPVPGNNGDWVMELDVEPGPPVLIEAIHVGLSGPGAADPLLVEWRDQFPMRTGTPLSQLTWEEQKSLALEAAIRHGYLSAYFSDARIELDLVRNQADLHLELASGEQAVMGQVRFDQDTVREGILESLPRWKSGQPYDQWLLEEFRLDLWRTGYFDTIEVLEERHLERSPPTVDLAVQLEARNRNTYQGSLGYGTDSGARLHASWRRHFLSERGDTLDLAVGWQQSDNEYHMRAAYRLPRLAAAREYWTADASYRSEKQNLLVRPEDDRNELLRIARGSVQDYLLVPGLLKVRNLKQGYQRIFEHWQLHYLNEKPQFSLVDANGEVSDMMAIDSEIEATGERSETWAPGVTWDWPVIRGNGYETEGHRATLALLTSQTAWGSDLDFSQVYLSGALNRIMGNDWKLLLRGEVGWSDARVREVTLDTGTDRYPLSVTELPFAYRFKAGGSRSVRGYAYESLSNNNIGSNNIITLSAEIEYRFLQDWSLAAFFDAGNAFNEWSEARLMKGYGLGLRWYSIAGAVRLDVAQAVDEPGQPWRIHFTIGTPLL